MSAIRLGTAGCVRAFQALSSSLKTCDSALKNQIDAEALGDELGRFRVWSGNLGALQKGHSSLDYRLRDSPLLSSNVLKLLAELRSNLIEAQAVLSGNRLPYEQQPRPVDVEEDSDDGFFSEDDDDSEEGSSKTELQQRFWEVVDIIDNLYKLSVRIRSPTLHTRSLKAASFRLLDPDTGVDMFEQYGHFDLLYTRELLSFLRTPCIEPWHANMDDDYMVHRLSKAITLRRRQFKYWRRHRDKLALVTGLEDISPDHAQAGPQPELHRHISLQVNPENIRVTEVNAGASEKVPKSLLSGTEATQHHRSLDELVDSKSVTSYATTTRDLTGRGIDLPSPPRAAYGEKDFECPYCYIICPARYGNGRAWRTHLLQDLQPYVCTYEECQHSDQLFRSRREWTEHESTHRKLWRCPEHLNAIYRTQSGLEDHLHNDHANTIADHEITSIVKIGETSEVDPRERCPICFAVADMEGGLQNHIANHLERLASFALPKDIDNTGDESDDASSAASLRRGTASVSSQDLNTVSSQTGSTTWGARIISGNIDTESDYLRESDDALVDNDPERHPTDERTELSSELLNNIPDESKQRLDILLSTNLASQPVADATARDISKEHSHLERDDSISTQSSKGKGKVESATTTFPRVVLPDEIPSIQSMYATGQLQPKNPRCAPNYAYNQIISLIYGDIIQLKVDAIVNSARTNLKASAGQDNLDYYIRKSAGPGLTEECRRVGPGTKVGEARITSGYDLPCQKIIHAVKPGFYRPKRPECFDHLASCYRSVLKLAQENQIKTIAIPALSTGGMGFPSLPAAETAIGEIRKFLDDNQGHHFEKIIFMVTNNPTKNAYELYLPVFFPPVEEIDQFNLKEGPEEQTDVDSKKSLDLRLARLIQWFPKVFGDLFYLTRDVPTFPSGVPEKVDSIADTLGILSDFWDSDTTDDLDTQMSTDVEQICITLETLGGAISELVDAMLENEGNIGAPTPQQVWDQFSINLMKKKHHSQRSILDLCEQFIRSLNDTISRNVKEPAGMQLMREKLAMFFHESPDEIFHVREYRNQPLQDDTVPSARIPTLSRLYQIGELEYRPTEARPDSNANHTICLLRGDITKLGVDVIVNSTDVAFSGLGTLDRTIFKLGGLEMKRNLNSFGVCQHGDVRVTTGHGLPCKYVIHAVPPEDYLEETSHLLRKCYGDALLMALGLAARTIAFPAIGTGALGHSLRDATKLAIEEVKGFLGSHGSAGQSHFEKIIFCVFSEYDEAIYKALLPLYFPPVDNNVNESIAGSSSQAIEGDSSSRNAIEEVLSVSNSGEDPSRPLNAVERQVLTAFEAHATDCPTCKDPAELYTEDRELCSEGYQCAQNVLRYLYTKADGQTYSVSGEGVFWTGTVQIPSKYPISKAMLLHTELSYKDVDKVRPFVTPNQSWADRARARRLSPQDFSTELEERITKQSLSVKIDDSEVDAFNKSYPTRTLSVDSFTEIHAQVNRSILDYIKSKIRKPSDTRPITMASAVEKLVNHWVGHWYPIAEIIKEIHDCVDPVETDHISHITAQIDRYRRNQLRLHKVDMIAGPPTIAFKILSIEEIAAFHETGVGFEEIDSKITGALALALEGKLYSKGLAEGSRDRTQPPTMPVASPSEEEETAFAFVFVWFIGRWEPLHSGECIVVTRTGHVEIHTITEDDGDNSNAPLLSFELPPSVPIVKGTTGRDIIVGDSRVGSRLNFVTGTRIGDFASARNRIMLRTSTPEDCIALLETLTQAGHSDPALVAGQKAQRIAPQSSDADIHTTKAESSIQEPQPSDVPEAASSIAQEHWPMSSSTEDMDATQFQTSGASQGLSNQRLISVEDLADFQSLTEEQKQSWRLSIEDLWKRMSNPRDSPEYIEARDTLRARRIELELQESLHRHTEADRTQILTRQQHNPHDIFRSEPIKDGKSVWVAVFSPSVSAEILRLLPELLSATHRSFAYRKASTSMHTYDVVVDDDGEKGAGEILKGLLDDMNVYGSVVVAKWDGGGRTQPKKIERCAEEAIRKWMAATTDSRKEEAVKKQEPHEDVAQAALEETEQGKYRASLGLTEPLPDAPASAIANQFTITAQVAPSWWAENDEPLSVRVPMGCHVRVTRGKIEAFNQLYKMPAPLFAQAIEPSMKIGQHIDLQEGRYSIEIQSSPIPALNTDQGPTLRYHMESQEMCQLFARAIKVFRESPDLETETKMIKRLELELEIRYTKMKRDEHAKEAIDLVKAKTESEPVGPSRRIEEIDQLLWESGERLERLEAEWEEVNK
jgi:O-acetyl-ADP-ribose deacetylase (regulator of RNase III)